AIGSSILRDLGKWSADQLGTARIKVLVVSNPTVFGLYGKTAVQSLSQAGFEASEFLIGDGERFKTLKTFSAILEEFSRLQFKRTDVVIALGGGVVGDVAGFAAATHLRGIRFLQVPTTLLAMIDSSVGGKTGINSKYGKNLIGAFHQPSGVLIDTAVLKTLTQRELTAGFCEAVKQGALGGKKLFDATSRVIDDSVSARLFADQPSESRLVAMIAEQVKFKAGIVRDDEREEAAKNDPRSRKILNFGHTLGHALEKVTNYRYFKHGEAVGHGMMFAVGLSKKLELIGQDEVNLFNAVVRRTGDLPSLDGIDPLAVLDAFKHDKKNIADSLQWILLRGIGKPVIVSDREIPQKILSSSIREFLSK
ncbi:MAG: 3-dehydroquinate synthase, partial [Acidobacteriota bacterium]